jgi:hypothetical protein
MMKPRRIRWAGYVTRMEAMENAYKIVIGKPEEKGQLGRSMRSWEDNIKKDFEDMGVGGYWIYDSG